MAPKKLEKPSTIKLPKGRFKKPEMNNYKSEKKLVGFSNKINKNNARDGSDTNKLAKYEHEKKVEKIRLETMALMDFPQRGEVPITGTTENLIVRTLSNYKGGEEKKDFENVDKDEENKSAKNTYYVTSLSERETQASIWQATSFLELFRGESDKSSQKKEQENKLDEKNEKFMKKFDGKGLKIDM